MLQEVDGILLNEYQKNFFWAAEADATHSEYLIPIRVEFTTPLTRDVAISLTSWMSGLPNIFAKLIIPSPPAEPRLVPSDLAVIFFTNETHLLDILRAPLSLRDEALFRVYAMEDNERVSVMYFVFHHILIDQEGIVALMQSLDAYCLQNHYVAHNLDTDLEHNNPTEQDVNFWLQQLEGFSCQPFRAANPDGTKKVANRFKSIISERHTLGIERYCQSNFITPSIFFNGILALITSALQHKDRVLIGTVMNARSESSPVIGCFANTVYLPLDLSFVSTTDGLWEGMTNAMLDILEKGKVPYWHLRESLIKKLGEDIRFHVFTSYSDVADQSLDSLSWQVLDAEQPKFPLNVIFQRDASHHGIEYIYDTSWFTEEYISAVNRMFMHVMKTLLTSEQNVLSLRETDLFCSLSLLDSDQYIELSLLERFERDTIESPQSPFCIEDNTTYSRKEIDDYACSVAAFLSKKGIGPGERVLIIAPRDYRFVCMMLGVWKIGASFVAIDEATPYERIRHMADESGAVIGFGERDMLGLKLPSFSFTEVLNYPATNFIELIDRVENDLEAYVIFTSGTTGQPKGISTSHRNLTHYAQGLEQEFERAGLKSDAELTFAVASTLSADLGYTCIISAIFLGGRLAILPYDTSVDASMFSRTLKQRQVDVLKITPSHLWGLARGNILSDMLPSTCLITGGEKLAKEQLIEVLSLGVKVLNHYGPAETTIGTCVWQADSYELTQSMVPIGYALGTNQLFVTDHHKRTLPTFISGELIVIGPGVSKGYLSPENNRGFFLFKNQERAYATGDVVWADDSECFHFIGRQDRQVKVSGYRVEMAEVEERISQFIAVSDFRLLYDSRTLVLFTLRQHSEKWSFYAEQLRAFLPEYMIPGRVVSIHKIPITRNGKTDESQLRMQLNDTSKEGAASAIKLQSVDPIILACWRKHIGEPKSINDSIYSQGASSISAMLLLADLQKKIGVKVALSEFLQQPRLCFFHNQNIHKKGSVPQNEISERGYSLDSLQVSMWNINQLDPQNHAYNVPLLLRLNSQFSYDDFFKALNTLVAAVPLLRTFFYEHQDILTFNVKDTFIPYVELDINFSGNQEKLKRLCHTRIELDRQCPYRIFYDNGEVLLILHHILTDAWSNQLLLKALDLLLVTDNSVLDIDAEAFVPSYAPCKVDDAKRYWRNKFKGKSLSWAWPESSLVKSPQEERIKIVIPAADVFTANQLFIQLDLSLQSGCLALYGLVTNYYFNQLEKLTYFPASRRKTNGDFKKLGFGITTLPILIKVSPQETVEQYLKTCQQEFLSVLAHQDIEFDKIVSLGSLVSSEGKLKSNNMFVFETVADNQWQNFQRIDLEEDTSKFDLTFDVLSHVDGSLEVSVSSACLNSKTLEALANEFHHAIVSVVEQRHTFINEYVFFSQADSMKGIELAVPKMSVRQTLWEVCEENELFPAIKDGSRSISYGELMKYAKSVAHLLHQKNTHDAPVVVHMNRSIEAIAAILGVIISGYTVVPLDGDSPTSRVERIKAELNQSLVIDQTFFDQAVSIGGTLDNQYLQTPMSKNRPLYMIFTSGSSGAPKGVSVQDDALNNYLTWARDTYNVKARGCVPLFTSLSYDLTLTSLFLPLMVGAEIDVIGGHNGIETLAALAAKTVHYSMMKMTPSHLDLLSYLVGEQLINTDCLIVGGEQLYHEMLKKVAPTVPVFNEYGPAEATVGCAIKKVYPQEGKGVVSIGTPVANTQLEVFGVLGRPLPEGIVGELVVSGIQVFSGYFQQGYNPNKSLTQYFTGDLVCVRDREFFYIGREDRQLKIDGHRIELGEIESVLLQYPYISSAQVDVWHNKGMPVLLAIITPSQPKLTKDEVMQYLQRQLSKAMVPSRLFFTDEAIFSDSGKMNITSMMNSSVVIEQPILNTFPKSKVRDIWQELLGEIILNDHINFFDAGGNSRMLLQLTSLLSGAFGVTVRAVDLLQHTTISQQKHFLSGDEPRLAMAEFTRQPIEVANILLQRRRGTR
ncbi:surfactin synthetase [Moritella sp. PE36]|uniref:AMP-binding protein n=1 Tax=Moritella sp. PE36 TaxID=58051 RepID=UPI00015699D2|nr:AMP-binding protein [Moritella sp. PE36]EDM66670.1 surfactin synthetase [Moritella sp. PE36]